MNCGSEVVPYIVFKENDLHRKFLTYMKIVWFGLNTAIVYLYRIVCISHQQAVMFTTNTIYYLLTIRLIVDWRFKIEL